MAKRADRRRAGGIGAGLLVLLALGVIAGGAWNYRRNLAAEQAARAQRPLAGYAAADLQALAAAYRDEVRRLSGRYEAARERRVDTEQHAFFGEQLDEYERVRRASGQRREVGATLGQSEAALRDVERELQARGAEGGSGWQIHLRRLLTF
jgi:hypothetical protein